jgi:hypothetical protein
MNKKVHRKGEPGQSRRRLRSIWLAGVTVGLLGGTAGLLVAFTGTASGSAGPAYSGGKLARITAEQNMLAKEQAEHPVKPSYSAGQSAAVAAGNQPAQQRSAGITNIRQGPFSPATFEVQDMYQGQADGTWVLVYAGATSNATGALSLYAEPQVGGPMTALGTFAAPAGTGPLTVTAASGSLLTLSTSQGQRLTFNLATHQYSS